MWIQAHLRSVGNLRYDDDALCYDAANAYDDDNEKPRPLILTDGRPC